MFYEGFMQEINILALNGSKISELENAFQVKTMT